MRKGSLTNFLAIAFMIAGSAAYAASPVLSALPVIVISDEENNSTQDLNVFTFTASTFQWANYMSDADTNTDDLQVSFWWDTSDTNNVGSISINGIGPLADVADRVNPAAVNRAINFVGGTGTTNIPDATFREETLSPSAGTAPFAAPATTVVTQDVNADSYVDRVVGRLQITVYVADDQNSASAVAERQTFVYTIDTNPSAAGAPSPKFGPATLDGTTPRTAPLEAGGLGDALVTALGVPALTFNNLPFNVTQPAGLTNPNWGFRNWTDEGGNANNWLFDAVSGTEGTAPFSALSITGTTNGRSTSFFGAAYGVWTNEGNALAQFEAGNIYMVRAGMGVSIPASNTTASPGKTTGDSFRVFAQENTRSPRVDNASISAGGAGHPFLAPNGQTRNYGVLADPVDADIVRPGAGPNTDLYFTVGFEFVNTVAGGNFLTGRLSGFEIGSGATTAWNANTQDLRVFGAGSGEARFDGSANAPVASYPGWGVELFGPFSAPGFPDLTERIPSGNLSITAGSVAINVPQSTNIPYVDLANFAFFETDYTTFRALENQVDVFEVAPGVSYRVDYTITNGPGTVSPTTRPDALLRLSYPIATISARVVIIPQRGATVSSLFGSGPEVIPFYLTAPSQYTSVTSPSSLTGDENDLITVFGAQQFAADDGLLTLTGVRLIELGDDPNLDY